MFIEGNRAVKKAIKQMQAAKTSEWISFGNALPKPDIRVLIHSNYGVTVGQYSSWSRRLQDYVSGSDEGMEDIDGVVFKPTHWMPLPEPPKEPKE